MAVEQKVRGILILRVPSTGDVTTVLNDDLGLSHCQWESRFFFIMIALWLLSPLTILTLVWRLDESARFSGWVYIRQVRENLPGVLGFPIIGNLNELRRVRVPVHTTWKLAMPHGPHRTIKIIYLFMFSGNWGTSWGWNSLKNKGVQSCWEIGIFELGLSWGLSWRSSSPALNVPNEKALKVRCVTNVLGE